MYKTKVTEIGELVPEFKEESLLVLFGEQATPELRDMSVIHGPIEKGDDKPAVVGGTLKIGSQAFKINQVGIDANKNLLELGHISIYFRDEEQVLPGAIAVEPHEFTVPEVGDIIEFVK